VDAAPTRFRVYGMAQSYFTRKMTGYLDYKGLDWSFRRSAGISPEARAAGWPGGFPALRTPEGEFMWDSSAMIHYLEARQPEPGVFPPDPVRRFLDYAIEDVLDEWLYRPAVGTRWYLPENTAVGGLELARDVSLEMPLPWPALRAAVETYTRSTCPPMGVTAANVGSWVDEVIRPWQRVVGAHLAGHAFFFGSRPALADFALFGANAAHFTNDPLCRLWIEEDAPAAVRHTHRLLQPDDVDFGAWDAGDGVPDTLVAVLADLGRLYLPWVSRATREGSAELVFASGQRVSIAATEFLVEARAVLLARYRALRSDALDAVLERAGILRYFEGFMDQAASSTPEWTRPPRPVLNRPYPPPAETEAQVAAGAAAAPEPAP
jgi:glutathione S-transferase